MHDADRAAAQSFAPCEFHRSPHGGAAREPGPQPGRRVGEHQSTDWGGLTRRGSRCRCESAGTKRRCVGQARSARIRVTGMDAGAERSLAESIETAAKRLAEGNAEA